MVYLTTFKTAFLLFPFVAFLITIPFMLIEYHKYGSINKLRVLSIYSFILYLMTIYFLVILPLPSKEYVSSLTTPKYQLIPFKFVYDFIKEMTTRNLYGKYITIELIDFIRDERCFNSKDEFLAQIAKDKEVAMAICQKEFK